jgi:outer membrane lipoprotein SlyB
MQMTDVIDRKTTAKTTSMEADLNRDPPITETLGDHPLGTGAGAASGGVAGAVIGMAGGPVGMVVGAAVGAVAGGLAGKGLAEAVNPTLWWASIINGSRQRMRT